MFEDIDSDVKPRIDGLNEAPEDRITRVIARDDHLSEIAIVLRSIPGTGPVAGTTPIAEMPRIGTITGEEAAAPAGPAPVAHDSKTRRGTRAGAVPRGT